MDNANNTVDIDWPRIEKIIEEYEGNTESLLMMLQDVSGIYNYLPPELIPFLAEKLDIDKSLIYSVATFYKTISLVPRGKHIISVCTGTACHVRGAEKLTEALKETLGVDEGVTTEDRLFTLETVRCIGCCAAAPLVTVGEKIYGGLDRSSVIKTVDTYKQQERTEVKQKV